MALGSASQLYGSSVAIDAAGQVTIYGSVTATGNVQDGTSWDKEKKQYTATLKIMTAILKAMVVFPSPAAVWTFTDSSLRQRTGRLYACRASTAWQKAGILRPATKAWRIL